MTLDEFKSEVDLKIQELERCQDHLINLFGICSPQERRNLVLKIAGIRTHSDALTFILAALNSSHSIQPIQVPTPEEDRAHQNIIAGLNRNAHSYATGREVLVAADNFLAGAQVIAGAIAARSHAAV